MRKKLFSIICICLILIGLPGFSKCGGPSSDFSGENSGESGVVSNVVSDGNSGEDSDVVSDGNSDANSDVISEANSDNESSDIYLKYPNAKISEYLVLESKLETEYAEGFEVYYYEEGYVLLITVEDDAKFLIIPEGKDVPKDIKEEINVVRRPIKDVYLVASAVMDMFAELDSVDVITFSGKKEEDWYIKEAKDALQNGDMVYAGKYSKPDYETIVASDCPLVIENTMIYHSPEVKERFEEFEIPVMVEFSNYENHPLGRVEWVKFFGALVGKDEEAKAIFDEQKRIVEETSAKEKTGKTVAYFYITSNKLIQVRKSSDYIPKMIEIAGGEYLYQDLDDEDGKLMVNMQIEQFYSDAKDADILIYNSSIDGGVETLDELFAKCELFEDFKAVKEGNVWCTTKDMYQESLSTGKMIEDLNKVINGDYEGLNYLYKLD